LFATPLQEIQIPDQQQLCNPGNGNTRQVNDSRLE